MSSHISGSTASTPPPPSLPPRQSTTSSSAQSRDSSHSRRTTQDSYASPSRHHHRVSSHQRTVKETRNAHTTYSNSENDGASQLRINQYIIQQEIGRGSFGAVHLAIDQFSNEFAVKEFSKTRLRRRARSNMLRRPRGQPTRSRESGFHALFDSGIGGSSRTSSGSEDNSFDLIKEEIAIMKKLNHPNLVALIEVLDDPTDDSLYMVLEMCKKGVIMKIEPDEVADPYSEEECRTWFRDLILGIEYLHAQGVIHRDIKPDNCLLTDDGTLKVSDFGVSEMFERPGDMRTAKSAGSPAFMAPELCKVSKGQISGSAADVWSMGVTLYCLRYGHVPFQKTAVLDLYNAVLNDPIDLPPDTDPVFADLIIRLLEKDPEVRIRMPELREHPWVTKNGEDPLLSSEENCAAMIGDPTAEELDTAITGNLGRVMAVMKAVNRFKALIERKKPELVNSILGHASHFVRPPVPISRLSQMHRYDKSMHDDGMNDDSAVPVKHHAIQSAKSIFQRRGDEEAAAIADKIDHLPEALKHTILGTAAAENSSENPSDDSTATLKQDVIRQDLRRAHSEPLESYQPDVPFSQTMPYPGKGQAHDPLEDHLFLSIGSGPGINMATEDETMFQDGDLEDLPYVVSESPPATDVNVYEQAYEQEVQTIRHTRGRQATIYLTRRVERRMDKWVADLNSPRATDSHTTAQLRQSAADLVNKAMSKSGYVPQLPSGSKSMGDIPKAESADAKRPGGLASVLDKAMAKAHYTPDQTKDFKQGFSGIVGRALEKADKLKESHESNGRRPGM